MNEVDQNGKKIICVGWHKTGTSTIGTALIHLGYEVLGARLDTTDYLFENDIEPVIEIARPFDVLSDVPWAALYKELDKAFPGSKFILTERDEQKWLRSAKKHFGSTHIPLHKWLYGEGVLEGNEELYVNRYRKHNREVREFFKDRPNDLLIMNFENGDGWKKLCPYVDHEIPNMKFPHSNKGKHNYNTKDKLIHSLRNATPSLIRKVIFNTKLALLKPFGYKDPRNKFNNFPQNRNELRKWDKVNRK